LRSSRSVVVLAIAVGLLTGALLGPAAAHKRVFIQMYATTWEDGTVHTQAWLNPEKHAGIMRTTLKKKNSAGDWVKIATKKATFQLGWGYTVNFSPVAGQKMCKAIARHTAENHPTITKASDPFAC
jgi:hypothetical protein